MFFISRKRPSLDFFRYSLKSDKKIARSKSFTTRAYHAERYNVFSTIPSTLYQKHSTVMKYKLPGYHVSLNSMEQNISPFPEVGFSDRDLLYPHPLVINDSFDCDSLCCEGGALPMLTLCELSMLRIMNDITDVVDWDVKIFDGSFVDLWRRAHTTNKGAKVTKKMAEYIVAELRWRASTLNNAYGISVYNGDVVKSDVAISQELKDSLFAAILPIEEEFQESVECRPGQSLQVHDLVDPSLWALTYGRTRLVQQQVGLENWGQKMGHGEVIPMPPDSQTTVNGSEIFSKQFQWLPCEIELSGKTAKITSYINNVHPQMHHNLYSSINKVIERTIPLWNKTLSGLLQCQQRQRRVDLSGLQESDTQSPEPAPFQPPKNDDLNGSCDLWKDCAQSGLQIIIKVEKIKLTPNQPEYTGGDWQIEGLGNEHICAIAHYYLDNNNITDSRLAFRQQVEDWNADEIDIDEYDVEIFGRDYEDPYHQEIGAVLCKEGRLLTFPNVLQHKHQPFKLIDSSRPGHRTMLALFLVDPSIKIISTAHVPPQRADWSVRKFEETFPDGNLRSAVKETKGCAMNEHFFITPAEAWQTRQGLLEERKRKYDRTIRFS